MDIKMENSCCCGATKNQKGLSIYELFSSLSMTIVGGVSLAASLLLMMLNIDAAIEPAWIAMVICGYPLVYNAIWTLINESGVLKISSALLVSLAMVSSIIIGELFAAGQVAFIMAIGGILEEKTIARANKGIEKLISLSPKLGRVINNDNEEMLPIEQIKKDDILRVLPGEAIPADGEILSGNTSVDQSVITGESLPIDKKVGDNVFCGTINRFGSIDIMATNVGEDSSLRKLIRLVQEAENKAPMQRIVDKCAAWLVPLTLIIAVVTYIVTGDITRAVTIAIVFCPCAMALSTPTSIMAAIGQATKYGVIIKSGVALERMGKVNIVAFDKTGTLTHGNLAVSDVISFDDNLSDHYFLSLAASVESYSEHPLGKAVIAYAKDQDITIQPIQDFKMAPGKGISAKLSGKRILCGNHSYLLENDVVLNENTMIALEQLSKHGKATILVSFDDVCIGIIALSDTLRADAMNMIQELKRERADAVLLTGDNKQAADYFAEQVGIKSIYAQLLPAQKVERIQVLQSKGSYVCMIGDGVNDAPALKTANVGVAMGSMGSDMAIEAADIALMGDDIAKIPYIKRLSNATVKLIMFNISISIVFNIIAIILSILGLLNPITGALAHNIGSVLVVLNAALLYDRKFI